MIVSIDKSRGFTLIELMIVITVTGVMSALARPAYRSYIDTANMTKLVLWRPRYKSLVEQRTTITFNDIEIKKPTPTQLRLNEPELNQD